MSSPKPDLSNVAVRFASKARSDEITLEKPSAVPGIAPRMIAAVARPNHVVRVMFADGEIRDVDVSPLLDSEVFGPLRDAAVFGQVRVDEELRTIAWPNGADLDPDVIYAALDLGPRKARIRIVALGDPA